MRELLNSRYFLHIWLLGIGYILHYIAGLTVQQFAKLVYCIASDQFAILHF